MPTVSQEVAIPWVSAIEPFVTEGEDTGEWAAPIPTAQGMAVVQPMDRRPIPFMRAPEVEEETLMPDTKTAQVTGGAWFELRPRIQSGCKVGFLPTVETGDSTTAAEEREEP